MPSPFYNPFDVGAQQRSRVPNDQEDPLTPGARAIVKDYVQAENAALTAAAKYDPIDEEVKAVNQRRTNIRMQREGVKNAMNQFLNTDGADLFERDPITGKLMKGPDKQYVPKLGSEVESLRKKSEQKTGLLAGALSPSKQAGDPTNDAISAQQQLAQVEPVYRLKQQKYDRIQGELKRLEDADIAHENRLAELARAREARYTVTPQNLDTAVTEVNASRAAMGQAPVSAKDVKLEDKTMGTPPDYDPKVFTTLADPATGKPAGRAIAPEAVTLRAQQEAAQRKLDPFGAETVELARLRDQGVTHVGDKPIGDLLAERGGDETVASVKTLETVKKIDTRMQAIDSMLPNAGDKMRPKLEKERAVLEKLRAQKQGLIDQIPVEDRIKNALGSFVSGSVGIGAGMLDSIAVASQRLSASLPDWLHRAVGDNPDDANVKSVDDMQTAVWAKQLREFAESIAPTDPRLADEFWSTQVPQGIGSMVGFLAGGYAGRAAKIAPTLTTLVLGMGTGGADGYRDAIAHGATEDQAFTSFLLNAGVGASEIVPISGMLDRLDKAAGGGLKKALIEAGKEGFEETAQEFLQTTAGNAIAQSLYDQNRDWFDGSAEAGAAGGISGVLASLVVSALPGKKHGGGPATPGAQPPPGEAPPTPSPTSTQPEGGGINGSQEKGQGSEVLTPPLGETPPEGNSRPPAETPAPAVEKDVTLDDQAPKTFEFTNADGRVETVEATRESQALAKLPDDFGPVKSMKRVEKPAPQVSTPGQAQTESPASGETSVPAAPAPAPAVSTRGKTGGAGSAPNPRSGVETASTPAPSISSEPTASGPASTTSSQQKTATQAPTDSSSPPPAAASDKPRAPMSPTPAPAPAAAKGPAIPRGSNSPKTFIETVAKASGLKAKDKATRFMADFVPRLHKANATAFKDMEVHVLNQSEWDATAKEPVKPSAAAYDPETNTLFINSDKVKGNDGVDVVSAVVHESGHFAEKFALGEAMTQREWEKLTHEQRRQAWKDYRGEDATDPVALLKNRRARAEWVAMQFARVIRGETDAMPKSVAEKLKGWLETVRDLVRKWVGAKSLTTQELDSWILDKMGYASRAQQNAEKPARRGKVGDSFEEGERAITASGRETTPFPAVDTSTNGKATNSVKRVDAWLHANAIAEAEARGDDFNLTQFKGEDPAYLPPASKDAMEEYLFGDNQPPVPKPFLKPITSAAAAKPEEAKPGSGILPAAQPPSAAAKTPETKPEPVAPQAETPPPAPAKSKIDELADKLFDGLLGTPPDLRQEGFPKDRRQIGIDLADAMIASGINTPRAMADWLDTKYQKKARKFSDSLWSLFRFSDPSLPQAPDWSALYGEIDAPPAPPKEDKAPEKAPPAPPAPTWEELVAKAEEQGLTVEMVDGLSGKKSVQTLKGKAAARALNRQRSVFDALRALADCLKEAA